METQTIVKNSQVQTCQAENTTQKVFTRRFYRSFSGFETIKKSPQNTQGQASSNFESKIAVKKQDDNNNPYIEKAEKANLVRNNPSESKDEPKFEKKLSENIFEKTINGVGLKTEANNTQPTTSEPPKNNPLNDLYFEPVSLKDFKKLKKLSRLLEIARSQNLLGSEELAMLKKEFLLEDSEDIASENTTLVDRIDDSKKPNRIDFVSKNDNTKEQDIFVTSTIEKPHLFDAFNEATDFEVTAKSTKQREAFKETIEKQNEPQTIESVEQPSTLDNPLSEQLANTETGVLALDTVNSDNTQLSTTTEEVASENNAEDEVIQNNEEIKTEENCEQSSEQSEESENIEKHYSTAQDFGKLATIFRDRRSQYQAYIFFLIVASVSAVTLAYKFSIAGLGGITNFVEGYLSYAETLGDGFLDTAIFASPFLLTSLLIYFGGYTLFAKVLSALWMLASGFVWGLFAAASYSVLNTTQMVFFSALSAVLLFTCVLFAAEAGKYSALNTFGKSELIKPSNIRQFTFVYIVYNVAVMVISLVMLRYIF